MVSHARHRLLAGLVTGALVCAVTSARAEDVATADALFREGTAKRKANKLVEACALFEESYRLDPAGGTTFALADCLEAQGKLAQAVARYREAGVIARQRRNADKEKLVAERLAAIEPRLPSLMVRVPSAWRKLAGLVVTRDDREMGPPSFDLAVPVDPGPHVVRLAADGVVPFSTTVTIPERTPVVVEPTPPEALASAPPADPDIDKISPPKRETFGGTTAPRSSPPPPSPPPSPNGSRTRLIVAGSLGAVGLASAAFSIGSFVGSRDKVARAAPFCPDGCDARGHSLYEEARTQHFTGVALGASAAAFLAGAGVLAFTDVGKGSPAVTLSPGRLSLGYASTF